MVNKYERESPWDWDEFLDTFADDFWDIAIRVNWDGSGEDTIDAYQWILMHFVEIWDKACWWKGSIIITNARKSAAAHAEKERITYMSGMGMHLYSRDEVEPQLYQALWDPVTEAPDIDAHIDLNRAVKSLGHKQREAIYRFFYEGEEFERNTADLRNKNRGIENILAFLNTNCPPGDTEPVEDYTSDIQGKPITYEGD